MKRKERSQLGRKEDDFWQYTINKKTCKYCGVGIPGASRLKFHLAQLGGGIRPCDKVPLDVKSAAMSALNSFNKRLRQSTTSTDMNEYNIGSSLPENSTRGIKMQNYFNRGNAQECRGKYIMGRKRDEFWQYVDTSNGNTCIFCGHGIPGASRIKFHLAQVTGEGIRICNKVPDDVRSAAVSALNSPNKRVKQSKTPSDLDEDDVCSNLSRSSTKGEIEVYLLPTTKLVGTEFQRHLDKIWEWLTRDEVPNPIMGVWGMGGVGKTTLLKHIHNKLVNHKQHVIWVTVSQNYSIRQLQRSIAKLVGKNVFEADDEVKIAGRLLSAFKKMNRCVVILDDMWCDISLEDVGISLTNNGIRMIVVSRLLDVCKSMDCKENIIKVEPLCYEEASILFSRGLEDDVTLSGDIRDIARELMGKCEGLPLAIVMVARSMRGKADTREWRNALSKLKGPEMDHADIKRCVFPVLKSSFDCLNDKTVQDCFLCLPLYFEKKFDRKDEKKFDRKDMIRKFVDEGLINGRQSFEAQLDEGHSILNKLINNSLLIESDDGVCLHKLVRAMAVNIGKESHGYMYKTELLNEREWKEDLQKISLISDEIMEIPFGMSPECPKLSTLCMCGKKYQYNVISDNFFINMPALNILDLSYNGDIESLPESISNLECLTVLLLRKCVSLHHIPSFEKLRQLKRLDLAYTAITQLPLGFENLTNLRWLNLDTTVMKKEQHLERLHMLESIAATCADKDEFDGCVRIIQARINSGLMRGYSLLFGDVMVFVDYGPFKSDDNDIDHEKIVRFESVEHSTLLPPTDIDELRIKCCDQWKGLCDVFSIQQNNSQLHISKCTVERCVELEYLFCSSNNCILCSSLQGLKELYLSGLPSLSTLCNENAVASSFLPFSRLTKLSIMFCSRVRKLLTPGTSTQFPNLEEIVVASCESIEEIFSTGKSTMSDWHLLLDLAPFEDINDITNVEAINLPSLKSVSLENLPQLKTVCKAIIVCGSLKKFDIVGCPKLERVPQTRPHFEIQVKQCNHGLMNIQLAH